MSLLREFFCLLPAPMALSLGERAGDLLRRLLPRKRAILRDNLRKSDLGLRGEREIGNFETKVFRHFGRLGAEIMRLKVLSDPEIARMVPVEGLEHFRSEFGKGRGVILLTGHIGNWEYSLRRIALEAPGKVHPVIRRIKSPVVHDFVDDHRGEYAKGESILADSGVKPLVRALSKGHVLIVLLDQNAGGEGEGVFVPFFGRMACTYSSLARLSLLMDLPVIPAASLRKPDGSLPVIPAASIRKPDGSFQGMIRPPISPMKDLPQEEAVFRQTALYTKALEDLVRCSPEQWIWIHRRWKTRPPDEKKVGPFEGQSLS
jgi:KDO2-lipid IV(A) lauroyltransferase